MKPPQALAPAPEAASDPRAQEALERFLALCHHNVYPPRTFVVVPGDTADTLYYVVEGILVVSMAGEDERDYILDYLHPGDFIGETGVFVSHHQREVSIFTRTRCRLTKITYAGLWEALEQEMKPWAVDFLKLLGAKLSRRLTKCNRRLVTLTSLDVQGRIARILEKLARGPGAQPHPQGVRLALTREELSRMAGCSREMASRALKQLEEEGLVRSEGRTLIILREAESD